MSRRTRRTHDDNFKARISIEAIKEMKTIAEIASEYDIQPNQVRDWKNEFLDKAASIFSGNKDDQAKIQDLEAEQAVLHQRIGKQAMELDYLKKTSERLGLMRKKK